MGNVSKHEDASKHVRSVWVSVTGYLTRGLPPTSWKAFQGQPAVMDGLRTYIAGFVVIGGGTNNKPCAPCVNVLSQRPHP